MNLGAAAPGLRVVQPGLATTVQDGGRPGYRAWGVPSGGAFDREALGLANVLVGNDADVAALELTLIGGVYEALLPLALALAGAPMSARIQRVAGSERELQVPQSFPLAPGDRLVLGPCRQGARTYLAVRGGWCTPSVLGSRSNEDRLVAGDRLDARSFTDWPSRRPSDEGWADPAKEPVRILGGPEPCDDTFWDRAEYRVEARSDRMGLRLDGPVPPVANDPERLSTPVATGTVQVAGGGLIVLGVACGTMGGYPQVAQVIAADRDRLGQIRPGSTLRFRRVGIDQARRLDAQRRRAGADRLLRLATLVHDRL